MTDLSLHLFNIADFLTNVTAPRLLTTTTTTTPTDNTTTPSSTTPTAEAVDWQEVGNTATNFIEAQSTSTLPPCACPTQPPPPTAAPVYEAPDLRAADLTAVERDVHGYLEQSDTVSECLAGYGNTLSRMTEWREAAHSAARHLKSDVGQEDTSDFAGEVISIIEQDELNIGTLFYQYAYGQVLPASMFVRT